MLFYSKCAVFHGRKGANNPRQKRLCGAILIDLSKAFTYSCIPMDLIEMRLCFSMIISTNDHIELKWFLLSVIF